MQFQSDVLQVPVDRPQVSETTALGAAYLAGCTYPPPMGAEGAGFGLEAQEARAAAARARTMSFIVFRCKGGLNSALPK